MHMHRQTHVHMQTHSRSHTTTCRLETCAAERGTAVATESVWHVIPSDGGPGPRMGAGAVVAAGHLVLVGGADMETGCVALADDDQFAV